MLIAAIKTPEDSIKYMLHLGNPKTNIDFEAFNDSTEIKIYQLGIPICSLEITEEDANSIRKVLDNIYPR